MCDLFNFNLVDYYKILNENFLCSNFNNSNLVLISPEKCIYLFKCLTNYTQATIITENTTHQWGGMKTQETGGSMSYSGLFLSFSFSTKACFSIFCYWPCIGSLIHQ